MNRAGRRPAPNEKRRTEGPVTWKQAKYSHSLTQELIDIIYANGVVIVKVIGFNDPNIQGCVNWVNHDNHLHVRFYFEDEAPGYPLLELGMYNSPPVRECQRRLNNWKQRRGGTDSNPNKDPPTSSRSWTGAHPPRGDRVHDPLLLFCGSATGKKERSTDLVVDESVIQVVDVLAHRVVGSPAGSRDGGEGGPQLDDRGGSVAAIADAEATARPAGSKDDWIWLGIVIVALAAAVVLMLLSLR